ncbi:MAG: ATP-dependent Clp protease ATP-binding subunit [Bacteroidetes bacterium]|nr:MAG: ATP-dependent Clp protease ATP-binding subunit [Bacteroidota bacterium]
MDASDFTFTDDLKQAISIAQSIAKEFSNETFSPGHLLKAVLHKDIGLIPYLESLDKDFFFMEEWADVRIEIYPKTSKIPDQPVADEKAIAVFEEADNIRLKLSKDAIDPICVLASLSTPGVGFSYEELKTLPITQNEIVDALVETADMENVLGGTPESKTPGGKGKKTNALLKYCIDKSGIAARGELDTVIGRDREIRMVIEILSRRSKPNVIVMGEPGVGKTSLINGFVQKITNNESFQNFKEAKIFELDYGELVAGASYKGEVEDRLKKIINEIKQFEKAILFIDEIHTLIDKHGSTSGAANLLIPELQRGQLTIIGTTSLDNYTKHIESEEAFTRIFETIKVEEPNEDAALRMLSEIIPYYEKHHNITVKKEVIKETIRLSKRYIKERRLPDAAIDLLDRTMAVVRMTSETSENEIKELKEGFDKLALNEDKLTEEVFISELQWFYDEVKNKISHILFARLDDETDVSKIKSSKELIKYLGDLLEKLQGFAGEDKNSIEKTDVAAVVSFKTGIPMGKVQTQERERLMNTEEYLKQRVVGQDHAIKSIAEAILESRSGLTKAGQPIGSFFFSGPTGTGKTELAKSLAEFLFQDETSMIRFDMSEFKEEHSAALLYGAPPGYVGYEEGGLLVNKIRQKPYSVVLFDEIEKAHTSVFDIFLQILDEGKLHDRLGKEGDFSNAVILFTSNIGSDFIVESFNEGKIPPSNDLLEIMGRFFRPEFLGRLTEILPFAPISEEIVLKIFNIQLKGLLKLLDTQGVQLEITDKAREKLAKAGFTPKYGARPIVGVIRNQLRRPLSRMLISGKISKGSVVKLSTDKKGELVWKT